MRFPVQQCNQPNGPYRARGRHRFDQSKNDSAKTEDGQQAAQPVEPLAAVLSPALRDFPQSKPQHRHPQRNIDEEYPSPRTMLDEPSTQYGADRSGDRGEAGPRPDRPPALLLGKISADESQAAGYKQRATDSLETPGNNKLPDVGRESTPSRG